MVFRGKRGVELTLYDAIEVVMALAVILTFYNHAVTAGRNTEWEKRYLASDIALAIDAAQAVPGDLLYSYVPQSIRERGRSEESAIRGIGGSALAASLPFGGPAGFLIGYYWGTSWQPLGMTPVEISQYLIDVTDGVVSVHDIKHVGAQTVSGSMASQRFIPSQLQVAASFTNPPFLAISKTDQGIQLTSDLEKLRVAQCPMVDTPGILVQKSIIIDPGESQIGKELADTIHAFCENCRVLSQRPLREKLATLGQADLIISLGPAAPEDGDDVIARIPLDSEKSSKLGCLLSNRLSFLSGFRNARIIPVDLASLPEDDPRRILQRDVPSVILQFGSQDATRTLDAAKKGEIARAIYDGLRRYYEMAPVLPSSERQVTTPQLPTTPAMTTPAAGSPSPPSPSCQDVDQARFQERLAKSSAIKVGAIGDSITAGPPSFLAGLQHRCPGIQFFNHGIRFNNVQQMAGRFAEDIIHEDDDEAIVIGGVNDLGAGRTPEQIEPRLQAMYGTARTNGMRVIAITILPWKGYPTWTEAKQQNTDELNRWLLALPQDDRFVVVDGTAALRDPDDPARLQAAYQQDWLHLTEAGADALADAVYQAAYRDDPRCIAGMPGETTEQACIALGGRWDAPAPVTSSPTDGGRP